MAQDYVPPTYTATAFNCPHCGAFAHQQWSKVAGHAGWDGSGGYSWLGSIHASVCERCGNFALWRGEQLFYPPSYVTPIPSDDMPENVKDDYEEARSIFNQSPRGAAALLRLAIQKLMKELGETGKDLNNDIGNLVKKGLSERIQQALDVVRVIGNNAVHPGEINIDDNPDTALNLFKLINLIVEHMITQPKEVSELFESLPEGAKEAISKRDRE